jgi:hypothetical protein
MNFSHYTGKSLAEVRNILVKRGMPPRERLQLLDGLREYRTKLKSEAAQGRYYREVWRKFARPLTEEIQKVRVAMYYKGSPQRSAALLQYREILDELLNLFKGFGEGTRTPKEIAVKNRIPNQGEYWTDWVPMDEKDRILYEFDLARVRGRKMFSAFVKKGPVGHDVPQED